ncbi:uncharacterized protein ACB058_011840 [Synchiropus picturatus]
MLAKILEEMWVEPAVLEALSEEQKRILFLKMREEQVRRWRQREEREGPDACSRPKKEAGKHVSWLLGGDGDVSVSVIGALDELQAARPLLRGRRARQVASRFSPWCHSDKGTVAPPTQQRDRGQRMALAVTSVSQGDSEEEEEEHPGEDSDSESGSSSDNLGDWPPLHRPRLSHHGNTAPLKAPLSEAELVGSEDRGEGRRGVHNTCRDDRRPALFGENR